MASDQPTVRHIPIYVEGRDEPIINTNSIPGNSGPGTTTNLSSGASGSNIPTQSGPQQSTQTNNHQAGQPNSGQNSIFSRVKNFPVRSGLYNDYFGTGGGAAGGGGGINHSSSNSQFAQRTNSPSRTTIPVNVTQSARRSPSPAQVHRPTTAPTMTTTGASAAASATAPAPPPNMEAATGNVPMAAAGGHRDDSIEKIQNIQREVLSLMDQVEHFTGTSKRDKQYLYLDEMLTQNLLKLDTIDTEGKENIKQARREAIKCINICIAALERKTEAAATAAVAASRGQ